MVNTIIREAVQSDISAMISLLRRLFEIETDFVFNEQKQRNGLELLLGEGNSHYLMVAELNQAIVGMCSVQTLVSTAEGGLKAIIEDLVVHEAYRGKGVGRLLLAAAQEWARSQNVKRIDLLADRHNTSALRFYKQSNWQGTELICLQKKLL